jgi:hypothetical protein
MKDLIEIKERRIIDIKLWEIFVKKCWKEGWFE